MFSFWPDFCLFGICVTDKKILHSTQIPHARPFVEIHRVVTWFYLTFAESVLCSNFDTLTPSHLYKCQPSFRIKNVLTQIHVLTCRMRSFKFRLQFLFKFALSTNNTLHVAAANIIITCYFKNVFLNNCHVQYVYILMISVYFKCRTVSTKHHVDVDSAWLLIKIYELKVLSHKNVYLSVCRRIKFYTTHSIRWAKYDIEKNKWYLLRVDYM